MRAHQAQAAPAAAAAQESAAAGTTACEDVLGILYQLQQTEAELEVAREGGLWVMASPRATCPSSGCLHADGHRRRLQL